MDFDFISIKKLEDLGIVHHISSIFCDFSEETPKNVGKKPSFLVPNTRHAVIILSRSMKHTVYTPEHLSFKHWFQKIIMLENFKY